MRYAFPIFRGLLERSVVPVFCCAAGISLVTMTGCASSEREVHARLEQEARPDPILGEVHPTPAPAYGPAAPLSDRQKQVPGTAASRPVDDLAVPDIDAEASNAYLRRPAAAVAGQRDAGDRQRHGTGCVSTDRRQHPERPARAARSQLPRPVDGDWLGSSHHGPDHRGLDHRGLEHHVNRRGEPDGRRSPTAVPNNFVDPDTALLQSRGVSDQHTEKLADGTVRVTAIVPRKDDPTHQTSYEAVGKDFATAAQLIVQKIDQNR